MNDKVPSNGEKQAVIPHQPLPVLSVMARTRAPEEATFDPTTREGMQLYFKATLEELPALKSQVNLTVKVSHVYSHDVRTYDKGTGAESNFRRTVVFDDKGNGWDCGSMGVDKALGIIERMIGLGPWIPPVTCKVCVRELEAPKIWLYLMPDLDELLARVQKPKRTK